MPIENIDVIAWDFTINQGYEFTEDVQVLDNGSLFDISEYTFELTISDSKGGAEILSLTEDNLRVVKAASTSTFSLEVDDSDTAALDFTRAVQQGFLKHESTGDRTLVCEGTVRLNKQV